MNNAVPPEKIRAWEQLAVAVLVLGSVSAVCSVAVALIPVSWTVIRLAAGLAANAVAVFLVVTGAVWRYQTRQLREALGDEDGGQRFAVAWVLAIVVFVVAYCAVAKVLSGPDPARGALVLGTAMRIAWIAIALTVTAAIRRDVRNVLTRPRRIIPVIDHTIRYDVVPTAGATTADDDFWNAAAASARQTDADLALLETTHSLDRRWFLIPASGDVTDLRAQLIPGAVLTLFPTPPVTNHPGATDLPRPPRADEYYGLIQPTAGAPVHFQLVLPSRVSDFLTRARGAHRAALYVATDPTARTAITPSAEQPA